MESSTRAELCIAPAEGPPPPLAGALAAWWAREGRAFRVLRTDPGEGDAERWIHLEGGTEPRLERFDGASARFFGPGTEQPALRSELERRFPAALVVRGDPEAAASPGVDLSDLSILPITTWAGFAPRGGAVRMLLGRGDRVRPVGHAVREVVYLVETWKAGHLLFDDADLLAYGAWWEAFGAELARLPWRLTWEGAFGGRRVGGSSR